MTNKETMTLHLRRQSSAEFPKSAPRTGLRKAVTNEAHIKASDEKGIGGKQEEEMKKLGKGKENERGGKARMT